MGRYNDYSCNIQAGPVAEIQVCGYLLSKYLHSVGEMGISLICTTENSSAAINTAQRSQPTSAAAHRCVGRVPSIESAIEFSTALLPSTAVGM